MASLDDILAELKAIRGEMDNTTTRLNQHEDDLKELRNDVNNVRDDVDCHLDARMKAHIEALLKRVDHNIERRLEEVFDRVSSLEGNANGRHVRREEIRLGKQPMATTSDPLRTRSFQVDDYPERHHTSPRPTSTNNRQGRRDMARGMYEESDLEEEFYGGRGRGRGRRNHEDDDDIKSIKFSIPSFEGSADPTEFLEWKSKVEMMFACHNYSERKKLQLAVVEFKEYALIWWEKVQVDAIRCGMPPIETWTALTRAMHARFVPPHYRMDLLQKIQFLVQGNKTVEEYYKEMEMLMMREIIAV